MIFLSVGVLWITGCASPRLSQFKFTSEEQLPKVTPYDRDELARLTYLFAYTSGYKDFLKERGDEIYHPPGTVAPAERDGYLAGVAAAFDARTEYYRTNTTRVK